MQTYSILFLEGHYSLDIQYHGHDKQGQTVLNRDRQTMIQKEMLFKIQIDIQTEKQPNRHSKINRQADKQRAKKRGEGQEKRKKSPLIYEDDIRH